MVRANTVNKPHLPEGSDYDFNYELRTISSKIRFAKRYKR